MLGPIILLSMFTKDARVGDSTPTNGCSHNFKNSDAVQKFSEAAHIYCEANQCCCIYRNVLLVYLQVKLS